MNNVGSTYPYRIIDRCVFGADSFVIGWMQAKLKEPLKKCVAIGAIDKDNRVIGGVAYHDLITGSDGKPISLMLTGAGRGPGWLTRGRLRVFFSYPFLQVGVVRLTVTVRKSNKRSIAVTKKLGFKVEGTIRKGFGDEDGILFGMLKKECRWIGDQKDLNPIGNKKSSPLTLSLNRSNSKGK